MKKNISKTYFIIATSVVLVGCQVRLPSVKTPDRDYYGNLEQKQVINGYPKTNSSWIAFSDRDKNMPFYKKDKNQSQKEIKYLEPLMVVQYSQNKKKVKVAEYNADALMKKVPSKSVKTYGWLPEENLLLWDTAISDKSTGFILKAAVVPNNTDVVKNTNSYIKNDSAVVYSSPSFSTAIEKKIPIGQLVYIYKKSSDNKAYMIGKTPSITVDDAKNNIYGWISANMISTWGQKSAIKFSKETDIENATATGIYVTEAKNSSDLPIVSLADASQREEITNIFPVSTDPNKKNTKYFTNAFDYSPNYIFNVIGDKLPFTRYKEITRKSKNLNIVFALNISAENRQYSSIANSIIQDVQLKIKNLAYYKNVRYGVVLYKNNSCGPNVETSTLTSDYTTLFKFIEDKITSMRCEGVGGQPVNEALGEAGKLLSESAMDETNLVVLVGSSSNATSNNPSTIRLLSKAKAKIISYQTISRPQDIYSNFVLLAENTISSTAANITELNKEKIADQSMILNKNNFNLVGNDNGFYSLNYPKNSMTQGFSIFPKKREENSNAFLVKAMDSLLTQVTGENKIIEKSLTKYFKNVDGPGSNKTLLSGRYRFMFPEAPSPIPVIFSSALITYDTPTLASGILENDMKTLNPGLQKGILVSELEYEELKDLYNTIYMETTPESISFDQGAAVNKYIKILKNNNKTIDKLKTSELLKQPMCFSVAKSTGFDNSNEEIMNKFILKGWKKDKVVGKKIVQDYFKNYKVLANRLLENKNNPKIKIVQNGSTFYWLSNYFMPSSTDYALKD